MHLYAASASRLADYPEKSTDRQRDITEEMNQPTHGSKAIDSTTPATTMDPSCSASASASDTSGSDGEPRPAGHEKKGKTTEPGVVCLEKLLLKVPREYLTLSLPYSSVPHRRRKRPEEVSLAHIDAPRDYLSLSIKPSEQPKRRHVSGGGGSVVTGASSVVASSGAPPPPPVVVVVEALLPPPPPPVQIAARCLPPKKRKLATACVYQETSGTAPSSSSQCLALAIVNHHNGVAQSSCPPGARGDGDTRFPATMSSHSDPIDAVPLQAVCIRGGVPHQIRLSDGASREIITTNDAASTSSSAAPPPPEPAWIREKLGLAAGHDLIFIAGKRVQRSDIDKQQSRLMIPRGETNDRLLPLLDPDQRRAAGLHEAWERPPKHEQHNGANGGERPSRVQGKVHGGLVVQVAVNRAGNNNKWMDAKLTRWDSNGSTVLKFGNAESFVSESGLRKDDDIQIWAFRRYGGLNLVIAKIDGETAAGGQQVTLV